jgi:hypothetical protein
MRVVDGAAAYSAGLGVVIANICVPIQKTPLKSALQNPRKWRVCNIEKWSLNKQLMFEQRK